MKRRANGLGTTYKLSGNRSRPWIARYQYSVDENQRRKWITLGYYKTKAEAEKALAINLINPVSEKHRIGFKELFDEWSESHYKRVKHQAQRLYNGAFALLSPLHNKAFCDIRTGEMQRIFDNVDKSKSYKNAMKALLSLMYKYAMENDICNKDYSQFVKIDREAKKDIVVFPDAEIKKLFDNDTLDGADMTLMLIYSGFRIQEFLNLTVFNVDLQNNTVQGGLKTENGINRIVPIHPKVKKYWAKYIDQSSGHLFMYQGSPLTQARFREYVYYPLLESLGIPRKSPHKCRDTCATLLARSGASTLAIQQIMGHSSYAFTADVYTAKDTDFLYENMCKI